MHFFNDPTPERGWGWTGDKEWLVHPLQILRCSLCSLFIHSVRNLWNFRMERVADARYQFEF